MAYNFTSYQCLEGAVVFHFPLKRSGSLDTSSVNFIIPAVASSHVGKICDGVTNEMLLIHMYILYASYLTDRWSIQYVMKCIRDCKINFSCFI